MATSKFIESRFSVFGYALIKWSIKLTNYITEEDKFRQKTSIFKGWNQKNKKYLFNYTYFCVDATFRVRGCLITADFPISTSTHHFTRHFCGWIKKNLLEEDDFSLRRHFPYFVGLELVDHQSDQFYVIYYWIWSLYK